MIKVDYNRVVELLRYERDTGKFFWIKHRNSNSKVGDEAGAVDTSGHVQIRIDGRAYLAHRLAWLYVYGEMPKKQLDHINRNPSDNRIENLREATMEQNARNKIGGNNKAGHRGVYWSANNNKWQASVRLNGRNKSLGYYTNKDDAIAARLAFEAAAFGEFKPELRAA